MNATYKVLSLKDHSKTVRVVRVVTTIMSGVQSTKTSTDSAMSALNGVGEVHDLDKQSNVSCMSDSPTTISQDLHSTEGITLSTKSGSENGVGTKENRCKDTSNAILSTEQIASIFVDLVQKKGKRSPKGKKRKASKRGSASEDNDMEVTEGNIELLVEQLLSTKMTEIINNAVTTAVTNTMLALKEEEKSKIKQIEESIQELEQSTAYRDQEIQDLQETNDNLVHKVRQVEGRLLRCEKVIDDLKEENIAIKSRSMSDNIVFYNIPEYTGTGKENCVTLLYGFLKAEMNLSDHALNEIKLDRAHRLGGKQHSHARPVIAKCATSLTKEIILSNSRNLAGTSFGVSEQVPQEVNERRAHLIPKFKQAKQAHQKPKWSSDKLIVNGQAYSQPKDLTEFSHSVPTPINEITIHHSEVKLEQGSSFQGHSANIEDTSQAIPTLHNLFTNHAVAKATHNMYAYRIKNKDIIVENCCDDGEFGAGKRLLNLMRQQNCTNKMIMVTRWYGGRHIGPKRFECILRAASDAI